MTPTLRPYQLAAIEQLRARIRSGQRRLVLVAPTGSGKTVIAAEMIRSAVALGSRVLVVAHRRELIGQTLDKLARFGVTQTGVIMAQDPRTDATQPVQVASVQTLARRQLPPADVLVYDEAHHSVSPSAREILAQYAEAAVIGLTATPWRSDGLGLADIYDGSVLAATPAELMREGFLVGYEAFAYDTPRLHEVPLVAGEFKRDALELACNTRVLVANVVAEYMFHASGRRAIVFPTSVAHSLALVEAFRMHGVAARHIDANTPAAARDEALRDFADGVSSVVSSVGVLTEGFDCPAAEVCILARPTMSLGLYLQMVGRVLRPSPETGKHGALIHDHAGNLMRHGFPEDERDYALTATPKRVRDLHTCPFCRVLFGQLANGRCPKCFELLAHVETRQETGERKPPVLVDGHRVSRDVIERMRAERKTAKLRDLPDAELARVHRATREEKLAEYVRLLETARLHGRRDGSAAHAYRSVFGTWPRFGDDEVREAEPALKPFLRTLRRLKGEA